MIRTLPARRNRKPSRCRLANSLAGAHRVRPTPMTDLAVLGTSSGGIIDAVVSTSVHYIRRERGRCLTRVRRLRAGVNRLRETEPETQRTGAEREWNRRGLGGPTFVVERRDERGREVLRKTTRARRTMPSTNGHANQWRERNWLAERDITRNRISLRGYAHPEVIDSEYCSVNLLCAFPARKPPWHSPFRDSRCPSETQGWLVICRWSRHVLSQGYVRLPAFKIEVFLDFGLSARMTYSPLLETCESIPQPRVGRLGPFDPSGRYCGIDDQS